jgi:hypothetical protein
MVWKLKANADCTGQPVCEDGNGTWNVSAETSLLQRERLLAKRTRCARAGSIFTSRAAA